MDGFYHWNLSLKFYAWIISEFKVYLHYKTVTPQSVLSEAQINNFFIS